MGREVNHSQREKTWYNTKFIWGSISKEASTIIVPLRSIKMLFKWRSKKIIILLKYQFEDLLCCISTGETTEESLYDELI